MHTRSFLPLLVITSILFSSITSSTIQAAPLALPSTIPGPPLNTGPFATPAESDSVFFTKKNPMTGENIRLGQYLQRNDTPTGIIGLGIDIDRIFFTADIHPDPTKRVEEAVRRGLLPETVQLKLSAFDIDSGFQSGYPCDEVARVFVNNYPVPVIDYPLTYDLRGADEERSVYTLKVETKYLNFPTEPGVGQGPEPARNSIWVEIDANKCGRHNGEKYRCEEWAMTVDWAALIIGNTANTIRPILFVHGWTGSDSTFENFYDWAKIDGIPVEAPKDYGRGLAPIHTMAITVAREVDRVAMTYGVDQINVFAHSKGGVVARAAQPHGNYLKQVDTLITFGTPHHGNDLVQFYGYLVIVHGG